MEQKKQRQAKADLIGGFMFAVHERVAGITEFDNTLWLAMVQKGRSLPRWTAGVHLPEQHGDREVTEYGHSAHQFIVDWWFFYCKDWTKAYFIDILLFIKNANKLEV